MNQTASATTGIAGIDHRPVRSAEDNVYQKITWRVMPIVLIACWRRRRHDRPLTHKPTNTLFLTSLET